MHSVPASQGHWIAGYQIGDDQWGARKTFWAWSACALGATGQGGGSGDAPLCTQVSAIRADRGKGLDAAIRARGEQVEGGAEALGRVLLARLDRAADLMHRSTFRAKSEGLTSLPVALLKPGRDSDIDRHQGRKHLACLAPMNRRATE